MDDVDSIVINTKQELIDTLKQMIEKSDCKVYIDDPIFIMSENDDTIVITVKYDCKCSTAMYIWLKWFLPYILNDTVFGSIEYEDSELTDHSLSKKLLTEHFNKYKYTDFIYKQE